MRLILSCQISVILSRRLSTQRLLGDWTPVEESRVVHINKDAVEKGEIVARSGVVGAVLGHDFRGRGVDPHPKSNRWRQSFLRVGAFKRRSERLEVRKREFGAEELMNIDEGDILEQAVDDREAAAEDLLGCTREEFQTFLEYVDARLADMIDDSTPTDICNGVDGHFSEADASQLPIEFRSVPFEIRATTDRSAKWRRKTWMSTGKRRSCLSKSTAFWMESWQHVWPKTIGSKTVPSSPRRLWTHPEHVSVPRRAVLYVQDTVAPSKEVQTVPTTQSVKGRSLTESIVAFLKTLPAFAGPVVESKGKRRNTFWPRRREGMGRHVFLHALSRSVRDDRFRFEWEHRHYFEGRLYAPSFKKRKQKTRDDDGMHVFGSEKSIAERYRSVLREARFRMQSTEDIDSDQ